MVNAEIIKLLSALHFCGSSPMSCVLAIARNSTVVITAALICLVSPALQAEEYPRLHKLTEVELRKELLGNPANIFIQLVLIRKVGQIKQDEAISLLDKINIDSLTEAQRIYYEGLACSIRIRKGVMESAKLHCEMTKDLLKGPVEDPISKAIGNNALGYYYARQGRPEIALEYFEKGLTFVSGQTDPALKVMLLHNRGVSLMLSGFPDLAIAAFEEADSKNDKLAPDDPLPNLLAYNLGYLQAQSGQHNDALESYAIALPWIKKSKQLSREYIAHTQISLSLAATEQYQLALEEVLPWVESQSFGVTPDSEAQAYLALANAYLGLGKRIRAQKALETGITIARNSENPSRLRELSLAFATMLIKNHEYVDALDQLNVLLTILDKSNSIEGNAEIHRLLAMTHAGLRHFPQAYKHSLLASDAQKVNQNDNFKRRLTSLRITNELNLKDQELALSIEREVASRASRKLAEYTQIIVLICLIVAFVLIFVLLSRRSNQRKQLEQKETENRLKREVALRTKEVEEALNKRHSAEREQAALELRLQKDDKLKSIGQLTGGVAHDFNNLMTVILLSAELLLPNLKKQDKKLIEDIIEATGSGRAITKDLLAYARQQTLRPATISLRDYIASKQSLFARSLNESIQFKVSTVSGNDPLFLKVDEGQLTSSMINLLINARDACKEKGIVMLVVERSGGKITISISDNGHGMSEEQIEHATEPFYSTKDASEGGGLGLSMVYGFMKQSGGELLIKSRPDIGSTITLQFNEADGEELLGDPKDERPKKLDLSDLVILFVEDEPGIREIGKLVLEKVGYKVLLAEDGDKAVEILSQGKDIDLLVTDLVMPGSFSGEKLAEYTRKLFPKVRILLMSGYVKELPADYTFLAKPFTLKELDEAVAMALDKNLEVS
ncbi:MAG: response regulator [Pseudomonadales bacterium]|nr:response regulator [Pseudomonadales bacterium]